MVGQMGRGRRRARAAILPLLAATLPACSTTARAPGVAGAAYDGPVWDYEVTASGGAYDLSVVATFPRGSDRRFTVRERADTFVVGVGLADKGGWREVRRFGSAWTIPECHDGCRIRYRYLLADGAGAWGDPAIGRQDERSIEAPPSTWLLRPEHAAPGTVLRFHVATAPGEAFVTGVAPARGTPHGSGIYEAAVGDALQLPYSAFGDLRVHELADGEATLALFPGPLPEADLVAWATSALTTVRGFYGRAPVPHVLILVRPARGGEVGFGQTMGSSGASIVVNVGVQATAEALATDWVLVHELTHTALPDLEMDHHWLEEGVATYVEPLARYRTGGISLAEVWTQWARRMSQGEPEAGDEGLDRTHTWGRTYWGGALFCLLADVEIRTATAGRASLADALRAIVAEGGNIAVSWPIERVLDVGDRATGTRVLHETYEKMAKHPTPVDLPTMWRRLGVVAHGDLPVTFDDAAELAWVRNAMTPPR